MSAEIPSSLDTLRKELDVLLEDQDQMMVVAIYLGMTPAQAQVMETRRKRIKDIYAELLVRSEATQS